MVIPNRFFIMFLHVKLLYKRVLHTKLVMCRRKSQLPVYITLFFKFIQYMQMLLL